MTVDPRYLPPNLRRHPSPDDFVDIDDLTANVPVTLYWGMERNVELDGFRPRGIPRWLGRFDWVVGFEYGWADTESFPSSTFCEPSYLPSLLSFLKKRWPVAPKSHSLLVAGAGRDYLLSWHRRRMIRDLGSYFSCIFYEAKDIDLPGVKVMPIGLTEHYVRSNSKHVLNLARSIKRDQKTPSEDLTVLAAWGAWWPALDELIVDRRLAREFSAESPLVTELQLTSNEWFEALSEFDFMLCPLGNGVQAPKMIEALLMGCIPIATNHPTFLELSRMGLPMLIVDEWDDLTEQRLREAYPKLFPEVMAIREKLLDLDQWWQFSFPCHPHDSARFAQSEHLGH